MRKIMCKVCVGHIALSSAVLCIGQSTRVLSTQYSVLSTQQCSALGRALSSAELALFCIGRAVSSLRNLQTMPCYCHSEGSAYLPSLHLSLMIIIIPHHHCILCYCLHLSVVIIIPGLLVYGVLIARGACLKERERDIEGGGEYREPILFPL